MIEEYLTTLKDIRKLSPKTVTAYRNDLSRFAEYCESMGRSPEDADREILRGFLSGLSRQGLEPTSINRTSSALRGFFNFLIRMKHREASPMVGLKAMKTHKLLPTFLSEAEVEDILDKPNDRFTGIRDKLVLEFLYSTGCRVAELAGMNLSDLSIAEKRVRVRGKGGRERLVFLGTKAVEAYKTWLPVRENRLDHDNADASKALVLNSHGRRITERGIFYIIQRYTDVSGAGRRIGPHTFRHSFATHVLNRGADLRVVQELLGHANLRTTQIYTHTGIERLSAVYAMAHPHARTRPAATANPNPPREELPDAE